MSDELPDMRRQSWHFFCKIIIGKRYVRDFGFLFEDSKGPEL